MDITRTESAVGKHPSAQRWRRDQLHSHNFEDAIWLVLGGRAAFYGEADNRTELSKHDGIILPAGSKYWVESVGDDSLEVPRVRARPDFSGCSTKQQVNGARFARFGTTSLEGLFS